LWLLLLLPISIKPVIHTPLSPRERVGERGSEQGSYLTYIPSSRPSPGGRRDTPFKVG
jgi:hypothetical protein